LAICALDHKKLNRYDKHKFEIDRHQPADTLSMINPLHKHDLLLFPEVANIFPIRSQLVLYLLAHSHLCADMTDSNVCLLMPSIRFPFSLLSAGWCCCKIGWNILLDTNEADLDLHCIVYVLMSNRNNGARSMTNAILKESNPSKKIGTKWRIVD